MRPPRSEVLHRVLNIMFYFMLELYLFFMGNSNSLGILLFI
jgi:hypothetical protein